MSDKAVIYVRVSSKQQDFNRQIEELEEYARQKKFKVVKCFKDVISASKASLEDRPELSKLKQYLNASDNVKNVLVHEVSRLGRKNIDVHKIIEEFCQLGVNIHIKDLDKSILDENGNKNPESNLIISILASMAENETRLLSFRIKSALLSSARKGLAFSPKINGYNKGIDGKPVIDEEVAPIIRRIFDLASKETTLYFISKKIKVEFNSDFGTKTISGIIKNPFYKGERQYLGETIPVDAIVDQKTWELANRFLASRKKFTTRYRVHENILEGRIDCYECGNPMHQYVIKKNRTNMFKCSKGCSVSVNRPWLFEMIRYVVEKHTKKLDDQQFKIDLKKKIEENEELILELLSKKDKIKNALRKNYKLFLSDEVDENMFTGAKLDYERDLKYLELKLKEYENKRVSYKVALKSKPQHYSDDLKTFKVQIQNILERVEVHKEFISINIGNVTRYIIPQLNPTKLGWINRKNKGKKMIFDSPFNTGIKIENFITDEDLETMIQEYINNNYYDEVEEYFNSKEYTDKMKGVKGLGRQ